MKFRKKKQPERQIGRRRPERGQGSQHQAFSYYSQRSVREEGERKERNMALRNALLIPQRLGMKSFLRQKFGLLFVTIAALLCLMNVLILNSNAKVVSLNSSSTSYQLHDQATYATAASKYFASSLLNATKLTANTAAVETQMQRDFPELSSVSVALPLIGHRPVVYIRTVDPTMILVTLSGQSFIIDERGKALTTLQAVRHAGSLNLPLVHDESGLQVKTGDTVLSSQAAQFVRDIIVELKAQGITINNIRLPAGTSELDVYPSGVNYYVKFNMQHDSSLQQAGTYIAVINKLRGQGITPAEYIDVRLDGRAYYK